ncbi:sensor histidine kinase [Nevskia sp.]|uniref:sensor histidine kinase n=1 Tax=Nevskia sp. TaxID=1929292 RepID=UPI003F72E805
MRRVWWHLRSRWSVPPPAGTLASAAADDDLNARLLAERQRIYEALHDDLGAKLLDLVYGADTPEQADRAREALQILRDVVSQARRPPGPLSALLAALQDEVRQRLLLLGWQLDWQQADTLPEPVLDQGQVLQLSRIIREAVSNALRHSEGRALRVRIGHVAPELTVEITDFGRIDRAALAAAGGLGLRSMRANAERLGADIDWQTGTLGGTQVLLRLPLPA